MKRHALKQFTGPLAFTLAYAACLHLASTTHPAAYTAACLAPFETVRRSGEGYVRA